MGFFKRMIIDLKEDQNSFYYQRYLEALDEREVWKDKPITFEEFLEGNNVVVDLYKIHKKRGRYD